ncbi:MAG: hypothetical protein IJU79_02790 [Desulfovibrionaceae bacterium]|nr:hypothetical protein [Desulfovibrionaceae bacterium]
MFVQVLNQSDPQWATFGNWLSYHNIMHEDFDLDALDEIYWENHQAIERISKTCGHGDGGHDKFLRMLTIQCFINAPQYWWMQFDTYKVATVSVSESKMHTLGMRKITYDNFEYTQEYLGSNRKKNEETTGVPQCCLEIMQYLQKTMYNEKDKDKCKRTFSCLLNMLPMGFLQSRVVQFNCATLKNMWEKRRHHKLKQWHIFLDTVINECPEFVKYFLPETN